MTPDFFDAIERDLRDAVTRQAHAPAWRRVWLRRSRALLGAITVLVVATPAVAAVTGLFSNGAPNRYGHVTAGNSIGRPIPARGELLSLRANDPDGGPAWGLRLVRTTRGYTCLQLGRVQNRELGSLGIDHYWDSDHRFHPLLPGDYLDAYCGVTDPRGDGFVAVNTNIERSGGTTFGASGPAAAMCRPAGSGVPRRTPTGQIQPLCPSGSSRLVYLGLLGPHATAITYTTPGGTSATERTAGSDGAYLLVFRKDGQSCKRYDPAGVRPLAIGAELISRGQCSDGETSSTTGVSLPSPITAIHYANGSVCHLQVPAGFDAAYGRLFTAEQLLAVHIVGRTGPPTPAQRRELRRADRRLADRYLKGYPKPGTSGYAAAVDPTCPWVGLVEPKTRRVTDAQVRSPITATVNTSGHYCTNRGHHEWDTLAPCRPASTGRPVTLGRGKYALIDIAFTARQAVHNAQSWYEFSLTRQSTGTTCSTQSGSGGSSFWDIRAGQHEVWQDWEPIGRPSIYCVIISYQPNGKLTDPESGGSDVPGHDGSLIVGRASFRVP